MMPAIAYTRLSKPNKKGKPGIGLDAQQAAIATFAKAEGYDLVEIFSEVETGEGSDALENGRSWPRDEAGQEEQGSRDRSEARPPEPRCALHQRPDGAQALGNFSGLVRKPTSPQPRYSAERVTVVWSTRGMLKLRSIQPVKIPAPRY